MRNSLCLRFAVSTAGQCSWMMLTHLPGFRIFGCQFFLWAGPGDTEKRPYFNAQVTARRRVVSLGWGEGYLVSPLRRSKDLSEDFVQAIDESGMGTKIGLQL